MSGRKATTTTIPGDVALSVGMTDMPAPPGWVWTPLMDIARLESGHTPSRRHPEYWDGDVPWIGIKDARMHHGQVIAQTLQRVTEEGLANSAARWVPRHTVCLSRTASVGYVTILGRPMATSQDFVNWICTEAIDPAWLMRLFQAEERALKYKFGKGTTHTTVYYPEVKAFHVCLPPVNEQRRIVEKIEALIARSRRAKDALDAIPPLIERFRQSVLAAAFRGDLTAEWRAQNPDVEPADQLLDRIRVERRRRWEEDYLAKQRAKGKEPKNDKWKAKYKGAAEHAPNSAPLPRSWSWTNIGTAAPLQPGYAFSSKSFRPEGVRLLKGVNVRDGWLWTEHIDCLETKEAADFDAYRLHAGDVVLAMDRPVYSSGSRGTKVVQLDASWEDALLLQRVGRFRTAAGLDSRYLYWFVSGGAFRDHIIGRQKGTQDGKDLPHVSGGVVDAAALPLPPLPEQVEIGLLLNKILGAADTMSEHLARAGERRADLERSVLGCAFRGELVPQDPHDEPASALLERIRAQRESEKPKKKTRRKRKAAAR